MQSTKWKVTFRFLRWHDGLEYFSELAQEDLSKERKEKEH